MTGVGCPGTEVSQQLRELEQSGWLDDGTYRAKASRSFSRLSTSKTTVASVGGENLLEPPKYCHWW